MSAGCHPFVADRPSPRAGPRSPPGRRSADGPRPGRAGSGCNQPAPVHRSPLARPRIPSCSSQGRTLAAATRALPGTGTSERAVRPLWPVRRRAAPEGWRRPDGARRRTRPRRSGPRGVTTTSAAHKAGHGSADHAPSGPPSVVHSQPGVAACAAFTSPGETSLPPEPISSSTRRGRPRPARFSAGAGRGRPSKRENAPVWTVLARQRAGQPGSGSAAGQGAMRGSARS